jgi:HEAT repeat protein
MNKCFWRLVLVAGTGVLLAGCGDKETKEALQKSTALEGQKQYQDANNILVDALRAREARIRADRGPAVQAAAQADSDALDKAAKTAEETHAKADQDTADALKKAFKPADDRLSNMVQADPEILKMERAQIPIYLHLERADLASAVYTDILAGNPGDSVAFDLLQDKDPVLRMGAVRILGLAGNANAIDALITATKDSNQEVRRAAVVALGSIKDPRTVPPLVAALKDSYWDVRSEAANALGQKPDGSAVKPLLDAVPDSDGTVESSAETALLFLSKPTETAQGHVGKAPAAPDDFAARLDDPNPKVVLISAVCLAVLKDSRCVPVLLKLVDSPDLTTRLDAVKGLGESGDPSVLPTLRQTLKDPDVNMRGWSIIGLGSLRDEASLPDLRAIQADPTEPDSIKSAAEAAIDHIAPPAAPPAGP